MKAAKEISSTLASMADSIQAGTLSRFFKTAPGEYGHGDRFLGIKVPDTRRAVHDNRGGATIDDVELLTRSMWHEERLAGFMLLIELYRAASGDETETHRIADYYHSIIGRGNNWDLVDLIAPGILGDYLVRYPQHAQVIIMQLALSGNLWKERAAIVATLALVRKGDFQLTLELASIFESHPHELMHKACGWLLREVGKRNRAVLTDYLRRHAADMPATALRYSIEKMDATERRKWMEIRRHKAAAKKAALKSESVRARSKTPTPPLMP